MLLIKNIDKFKKLKTRILVGHSRKSFITKINNIPYPERDIETYALSIYLMLKENVDYLRVHDVKGNKRTLDMYYAQAML